MDTCCQRDGQDAVEDPSQYCDSLAGMPSDVLGFRIGLRCLVEALHRRHFLPCFWHLQAVPHHQQSSVDGKHTREAAYDRPDPLLGKHGEIQGFRVKEIQESVIRGFLEAKGPNDTEDAESIGSYAHTRQRKGQPQEGSGACTGGAKQLND